MTKKCIGCGLLLQTIDKEQPGYTPDIKKAYCMRCFRLKNYGELKVKSEIKEEDILKKINKTKGIVFFFMDFLNINKETISIFNKIRNPKVLVISKSDTLRKEMKYLKIKKWLEQVYKITDEVLFISNKNKNISNNIFRYMEENIEQTAIIAGITNAGKSTFINNLLKENNIQKEILTSNVPNTTLDFIKIKIKDFTIYDTPGFLYTNLGETLITKEIKPITYNLKGDTTIVLNNTLKIYLKAKTVVTIYVSTSNIKREYHNTIEEDKKEKYDVFSNSDLIIPGIGFINIKEKCRIEANFKKFEVRLNISEASYE